MDAVKKCSNCKTFSSKFTFFKDISTKDALNPICKICRKGYYNEIFDKSKNYREQYDKNRKESDFNFKLACKLRSRTSKAFISQNRGKMNKSFDLLGCSHSFLRSWIIHQLYGNMTIENYGSLWQIGHCLSIASFNLLDENNMRKCFNWVNLRPMYSNENNLKMAKIDYHLHPLQEVKAKFFLKSNV